MATREELFNAVWAEPMTTLAKRFGVSSSYLARVCDSLSIPRPDRGYWAKKEVGKAPPKPELPEAGPGEPTSWSSGDGVLIRRSTPRPRPETTRPRRERAARVQTHALIQGASAHFLKSRTSGKHVYLRPFKYHLVDITTSEAGLLHALTFANELFLALEEKGHHVVMQSNARGYQSRPPVDPLDEQRKQADRSPHYNLWAPGRLTVAQVNGQLIGLLVVEVAKATVMRYVGNSTYVPEADYLANYARSRYRDDGSWSTTQEIPSGRLRLVAYSPHSRVDLLEQWEESSSPSLLKRIPDIINGIENLAGKLPDQIAEAERQMEVERRKWEEDQRRYAVKENKRRIEESTKQSREQLDGLIQQWARDRARADFLDALESGIRCQPDTERESLVERLELARNLLGSLDPIPGFRKWLAPEERYVPKHFEEEE